MFVKNITYVKINRRDIVHNFNLIAEFVHYKMHTPATPPKEGNGLPLKFQQPYSFISFMGTKTKMARSGCSCAERYFREGMWDC